MRPILLRLRNIASLRGEHLIDFREIQSHSPLFAITGETGSGKSSILNAIALALYGQVYKKNVNQVDVVTLGEKDGQIEFIFQIRGRRYLAEWRGKVRKQNGEPLLKPLIQRYIYPLLGEGFEAPRENPVDSTEQLLNLDFDQFCKCVILNQGEFARFLSSSFTERKEILEKFYPGETLEKLGKELRQQMETIQRDKNNTEIELNTLDSGGEDGDELKKKRDSTASLLTQREARLKALDQVDYHFSSLMSYNDKWLENSKRGKVLREQLVEETSRFNAAETLRNEAHRRLEGLRITHAEEIPRLQELLRTEESLKHFDRALGDLRSRLGHELSLQEQRRLRISAVLDAVQLHEAKIAEASTLLQRPISELKQHRETAEAICETFSSLELLSNQSETSLERLRNQEALGKELSQKLGKIDETLQDFTLAPQENLRQLETQRTKLSALHEERKKQIFELEQVKKQILGLEEDLVVRSGKLDTLNLAQHELRQEAAPLETTLLLQEAMLAAWTCVKHAAASESLECPVCLTPGPQERWDELSSRFQASDLAPLRRKLEETQRALVKSEEERKLMDAEVGRLKSELVSFKARAQNLELKLAGELAPLSNLDDALIVTRKACWEYEKLLFEKQKLSEELPRARENYLRFKTEHEASLVSLERVRKKLVALGESFGAEPSRVLAREFVDRLRPDLRNLAVVMDMETARDKSLQDKSYLDKEITAATATIQGLSQECENLQKKINDLRGILQEKLAGQSASALLDAAEKRLRTMETELSSQESTLKRIELTLRELKARLVSVEDLQKEIEFGFGVELRAMQEKIPDEWPSDPPGEESILLPLRKFSLTPADQRELFIPVKDLLVKERGRSRECCNELRMEFASLRTRIEDWERRQDKIRLLRLSLRELSNRHARLERLFEVLGKDELRTFILSLVEENLIRQTNDELQKLCQGRYEIVHLTRGQRMNPEFYILDKFREGGQRKVSTLSGGETFMVSLAMALALAEMTRGQAEVDSLFIDEGFGTLDQDSLEDVLEMLNQIQTRGLTVGIISHIKQLTNSLAVNLVLSKRNDGTSEVSIRLN